MAAGQRLGADVVGFDPDPGALSLGVARGPIGTAVSSLEDALDDAQIAVVAAPVGVLDALVRAVLAARALGEEGEPIPATGPSFRDATRVAGANSAIWTDIYLANRDALVERIDDTVARLGAVRERLVDGDAGAISAWNDA